MSQSMPSRFVSRLLASTLSGFLLNCQWGHAARAARNPRNPGVPRNDAALARRAWPHCRDGQSATRN